MKFTKQELELISMALPYVGDREIEEEVDDDTRVGEQCDDLAARIDLFLHTGQSVELKKWNVSQRVVAHRSVDVSCLTIDGAIAIAERLFEGECINQEFTFDWESAELVAQEE